MNIQEAMDLGYKFAYIKTGGGRVLRKLMLQRIPNPGEKIAWGNESRRVQNVMTIVGDNSETIIVSGYDVPVSTYLIFVEYS